MTWFVVHFLPGAPLAHPAMASGPWADRDLGSLSMDEWRNADEVREVTEHAERPDLPPEAFEWEHTPSDEYLTATAMGRPTACPPPVKRKPPRKVKVMFTLTEEKRDTLAAAAVRLGDGAGLQPWLVDLGLRVASRGPVVSSLTVPLTSGGSIVVDLHGDLGAIITSHADRALVGAIADLCQAYEAAQSDHGLPRRRAQLGQEHPDPLITSFPEGSADVQVEEAPHAPPPPAGPHEDPIEGDGQAAPPAASGPDGEPAPQTDAVEEAERPADVVPVHGSDERAASRSEALTLPTPRSSFTLVIDGGAPIFRDVTRGPPPPPRDDDTRGMSGRERRLHRGRIARAEARAARRADPPPTNPAASSGHGDLTR